MSDTVSTWPSVLKFGSACRACRRATDTTLSSARSMAMANAAVPASSVARALALSAMVIVCVPAVNPAIVCSAVACHAATVTFASMVTAVATASPAALAGASRLATLSDTVIPGPAEKFGRDARVSAVAADTVAAEVSA